MPIRFPILSVAIAAATSLGSVAAAQPPRLSNGRVTTQTAVSPLTPSFRTLVGAQPDVAWIGYSVPVVDGERVMCCFDSNDGTSFVNGSMSSSGRYCCGACRLEPSTGAATNRTGPAAAPTGPIKLEAAARLVVLFRIADRKVDRIRVFSEECELDAGGRPVIWLDGVRVADSVALLETFAVPEPERRNGPLDGAVTAIALHGDASADAALDRLVAASQPEAVRRKVTFWLGNARGAHGLATLQRVLRDDASVEVRKSAVFGVSQSRQPGAFDALSALARTDQEPRIRSEAVFWLSQKGDTRASAVILQALEKDPSPEVRKKAVFALSQLKDDAGVNALISVAKTATDASVRGEAIFWLGQKAGAKAAGAITDRIDNDPDTEVKKRAVFALSQMPASEGVPLLIKVARTNENREVRKQAMFWLGQSKDPRAVAFFEEILVRK
jgi:HEAT repeat protein